MAFNDNERVGGAWYSNSIVLISVSLLNTLIVFRFRQNFFDAHLDIEFDELGDFIRPGKLHAEQTDRLTLA